MTRISFKKKKKNVTGVSTLETRQHSEKKIKMPKIPFNKKYVFGFFGVVLILFLVSMMGAYFFIARPLIALAHDAKDLKASTYQIKQGAKNFDFDEIQTGLENTQAQLNEFETSYEKNMKLIRRLPNAEAYYQDGLHLINASHESIDLGTLMVTILEPYAGELGFKTKDNNAQNLPAQDRIVKFLSLMPQFSSSVDEIASKTQKIDEELQQIDAKRYPQEMPWWLVKAGVDPELNIREEILAVQGISSELSNKAPQFKALFDAVPEFMGLNEPKKYLILMANNYEIRMSGGFNTYILVVEFNKGIPQITYSIDTYFIDEGERTRSSALVNRNVPYFLRNYLYIQDRGARLYARDATSTSPDFPTAVDTLLNGFWRKDRTLPQDLNGVFQINNDVVVDILKVVGPVSTAGYTVKTDTGYRSIPTTEFNAENVIYELENIAGGKLAETVGRKEIIKFLADSIFTKIFTSEATNLINIANVGLESLSKKDVMLYSFDPDVQKAFHNLGYSGEIVNTPDDTWDYLHVNRSNFGSGKADWTTEGFVHQTVKKDIEIKDGKKISTVEVTIHNPKRPDWYHIDPCCFYRAYSRIYVPKGSKMVSITASDGQDVKGAEYDDEDLNKTYLEAFTLQPKETDLTIKYVYELPNTVDIDDYKLLLQRQSGTSIDEYTVGVNGVSKSVLLNSDKEVQIGSE